MKLFTPTCAETMESQPYAVSELAVLSHGVLEELWLEFPEFKVVGLIVLARVPWQYVSWGRTCAPTKICHCWHCRLNTAQTQYAICSALASSAFPALVMSEGHRIKEVPELLRCLKVKLKATETKEAVLLLKKLKAWNDINKVCTSQ